MKICVIGLGYVGAVTSCCLASDGHEVIGVDLDATKVSLLASGHSPIVEERIPSITKNAIDSGKLKVTTELTCTAIEVDLIFICVGTPSAPNGSQNLTAVERVCQQIGGLLRDSNVKPCIVMRSTVPAGTTNGLVKQALESSSGGKAGLDFGLGFQPEFLREGSSVEDFYNPPMTVVAGDAMTIAQLQNLFGSLETEFVATEVETAELLKVSCNTFHALKINFANEIGRIAKSLGLDSRSVMDLLCRDTQLNISPAYLRPGFAFGGSCLPKDLRALLHVAKSNDVDVPMLSGILPSNDEHIETVARAAMTGQSRQVGLVGLSFKQGTDDLRESPLVRLAEILIGKGYELSIYDPAVQSAMLIGANKRYIESTIPHFSAMMRARLKDTVRPDSTVIVAHNHPELQVLLSRLKKEDLVVDLMGNVTNTPARVEGVAW